MVALSVNTAGADPASSPTAWSPVSLPPCVAPPKPHARFWGQGDDALLGTLDAPEVSETDGAFTPETSLGSTGFIRDKPLTVSTLSILCPPSSASRLPLPQTRPSCTGPLHTLPTPARHALLPPLRQKEEQQPTTPGRPPPQGPFSCPHAGLSTPSTLPPNSTDLTELQGYGGDSGQPHLPF